MAMSNDYPVFDPNVYSKLTLNDLVLFSVHYLHKQGGEITNEDIISACFILFPKRFSLRKYPNWPDSTVVTRHWTDCRSKGYIVGSTAKGFKLTAKGFRQADKVSKMLGGERPTPLYTVPAELRTRAGRFVRSMETSDAFFLFKKNGINSKIGEFDFRDMLLCTMESSPETLKRNLEQFKDYAAIYDRQDLLTFLNFCEDRFSYLLGLADKPPEKKKRPRFKFW